MTGAGDPAPVLFMGTSINSPFAIWSELLLQLCVMKIPQYTKYSGISITEFGSKSLVQIIKKEFLEVAL
jgi:hypothetical protein